MIINILISYLLQIGFTIGIIILFGYLIALCNKLFYANFGAKSTIVCYVTGFIGTPIHELSHALMCVIFGHKINEIKLFQISSKDGTLGYVNHSYNPRNIYQSIGTFFIGVAPILVISCLLYLLLYLLLPDLTETIRSSITSLDLSTDFKGVFSLFKTTFEGLISNTNNYKLWIFVAISITLSLHMTLSGADINGAKKGLVIIIILMLIVDIILGLINIDLLSQYTSGIMWFSNYLLLFLGTGLTCSIIALIISYIIKYTILKRTI
ncbi:MAG: hypothetical protein IJ033_05990 [Clostridia bacterium]|nr:hypothetical protein [Clostridia bacterium]